MKCNVGNTDRVIRIVLGLAMAGAGVYYQSLWGLVAAIPLVTAFVKLCPLYALLGISTCQTESAS